MEASSRSVEGAGHSMRARRSDRQSPMPGRAVALRYSGDDDLPRVVAGGAGEIARRIIELAEEHKVPIFESDSLSTLLSQVKPGGTIPEESFEIVAEILCFLYHTDKEWRAKHPGLTNKPSASETSLASDPLTTLSLTRESLTK